MKFIDPTGLEGMECFHWGYIILPDGTISYELADLYNKLQDALSNLDEEDWDEINAYLESNDLSVKMEAVKMILDAAGIGYEQCKESSLMITVNDLVVGIMWEDLVRDYGDFTPTKDRDTKTLMGGLIRLNPDKLKKGGDLFMTLGHELVHAYHQLYHWDTMEANLTLTVAKTFTEYIAYTWSMIFVKNVPYVSQNHINDIIINYYQFK